jgi:hypothetical protein
MEAMVNESRILLILGFAALFATAAWTNLQRSKADSVSSFFDRNDTTSVFGHIPTIGVVFQPQDCVSAIDALRFWNAPHEERQVHVVGLLYTASGHSGVLHKVVNGAGIEFPVHLIDHRTFQQVRSALGYSSDSPVVVFDRKGRLRMTVPLQELSSRSVRQHVLTFASTLDVRQTDVAK